MTTKIQHEKQTALFCSLLPWSPSHVDRSKKKCRWKLFLFPSSQCCILGSIPVCKGFSWLPYLWHTLFAAMQIWRHWWRVNLWSYHLFHAFHPIILGNGNTYLPWICTWTYVLCLNTFPEAGPGTVLRCMCVLWIIVLQKRPEIKGSLRGFFALKTIFFFLSFNLQRFGSSLGITCHI